MCLLLKMNEQDAKEISHGEVDVSELDIVVPEEASE